MADPFTTFKIQAQIEGLEKVNSLKYAVRSLANSAQPAAADITQLRTAAQQLATANDASTKQIKAAITTLEVLQANVSTTSQRYRELAADIDRARARLAALNVTAKAGGFMAGAKAAAPTALMGAMSSFMPGAASFGAYAGYQAGGLKGGIAGMGIGLGLEGIASISREIKSATEYAAQISRLEIALRAVTKTNANYAKSQTIIQKASKELNIPIDVATKQFTQLSASILGSGYNIEVAENAFRGVSEAIKATGGNAEDVKSGIRAMSQIFGKGKLSAEELSGQLGERLAGAVIKFAKANNMTLEGLQKNLRDGTVGLEKVVTFTEALRDEHKQGALDMASSQEEAGERMNTALKDLKNSFGQFFKPVGAGFQNIITGLAEMATAFLGTAQEIKLAQLKEELEGINQQLNTGYDYSGGGTGILGAIPKKTDKARESLLKAKEEVEGLINAIEGTGDATDELGEKTEKLASVGEQVWDGMLSGAKAYGATIKTVTEEISDATQEIFNKLEDALTDFIMTGELKFKNFAKMIIEEMTRVFVRTQIMKPFTNWIETAFNAKGNVYAQNGIQKFARGGIIDQPTVFPFSKGIGLMGEAGPESIMPLKRGRDGKLGVIAHGGGDTSVVVNVDASGSEVQGDDANAAALGRAISSAVTEEIAKQKRPGGLLSAA